QPHGGLLSLKLQLVALFAAVLAATLLVAAGLGLRIAQRSVEKEVRDRTVELSREATAALRRAGTDDDQISEELAATIRMHRGLLRAELARPAALGIDSDFVSARITAGGITFTRWRGPLRPQPRVTSIVEEPDQGRAMRYLEPFTDGRGARARLLLVASLAEAERLVAAERRALFAVAVGAGLFLVAAFWILVGRILVRRLGQLAGTIAHELGNPLNAVSGHVQLLARRPDLNESARTEVLIVNGEVQRMAQIIRRFLDQTRGFTPSTEPVEVEPLLDEALDLTLGTEARAKIQVQREVDGGAAQVRTDPGLVRHLLTNLVANAVDAMPNGGRLEVQAHREGQDLVLRVADTGSGMAADVKGGIFEPFFRTKDK